MPLGRFVLLGAVAVAVLLAAQPLSAQSPPEGVPDIVQRAAARYASDTRGVVAMQRHFLTAVSGGPIHRSETSNSAIVLQDGAYARIKYFDIADDGNQAPPQAVGQREAEANRDWAAGKVFFKEPYDPRFENDYRFADPVACSSCVRDTLQVEFTSRVNDAQHGNGTMWIERASAHVLRLTYVPRVFPPHANSGSVTEYGGDALPDLWYVVRIEERFTGRAFLLTGNAQFVGTFDHFHRYAAVAEALDTLAQGN